MGLKGPHIRPSSPREHTGGPRARAGARGPQTEERPCVSRIEDPEVLSLGLLPEAAGGMQRGCEPSMTVVMRHRSAVGTTMPGAHRGPDTVPSTLPTATRRGHSTAPPPTFYGKAHTEGLSSLPVKNSYSPFKALPGHPCPDPLAEDLHPPLHPSESHLSCLRVCAHPLSPVLKGLVFWV